MRGVEVGAVLCALLVACEPAADDPPAPAADSGADEVELPPAATPLTADEVASVEASIEAAAVWVPRFGADPLIKVANVVRQLEDPPCPDPQEDEAGMRYWTADCSTPDGDRVLGSFGLRSRAFEPDFEIMQDVVYDVWGPRVSSAFDVADYARAELVGLQVRAGLWIDTADGGHVGVNGRYLFLEAQVGDTRGVRRKLGGAVDDSAPAGGDDDWVQARIVAELSIDELEGPTEGAFVRWIDGSITGLPTAWSTVVIGTSTVLGADMDGACTQEPSGVWSVRRPDGRWIAVHFDGPDDVGAGVGDACDGCGRAFDLDTEVGTVCPSLDALWVPTDAGGA